MIPSIASRLPGLYIDFPAPASALTLADVHRAASSISERFSFNAAAVAAMPNVFFREQLGECATAAQANQVQLFALDRCHTVTSIREYQPAPQKPDTLTSGFLEFVGLWLALLVLLFGGCFFGGCNTATAPSAATITAPNY